MKKIFLALLTIFSSSGFAVRVPPGVPSNINVEFVTPQSAKITWEDNTTNETGFEVSSAARRDSVTVKANSKEALFEVIPGQADTVTVCALGDGWDKACAKPFVIHTPRVEGSLSGQIVDPNFQPIANQSFKLAAKKDFLYEREDIGLQRMFIINDYLIYPSFNFNIAVVPLEENCKIQIQNPVRHNDIFREVNKRIPDDPSGFWFVNLKGDSCRSKVILNIWSDCDGLYCSEISFAFKTDENGRFTVEGVPVAGTYTLEGKNVLCTFAATGEKKISVTSSTKNANFVCNM